MSKHSVGIGRMLAAVTLIVLVIVAGAIAYIYFGAPSSGTSTKSTTSSTSTGLPPNAPMIKIGSYAGGAPLANLTVQFLAQEGVRGQLVIFTRGLDGVTAMAKGDIDAASFFLAYQPAIFTAITQNLSIVATNGELYGITEILIRPPLVPPQYLDTKTCAYNGTQPWNLLVNRTVAAALGSTQDAALRAWLGYHGIDVNKQVHFISILSDGAQQQALVQGSIDAVSMVEPSATVVRFNTLTGGRVVCGPGVLLAIPYNETPLSYLGLNSAGMVTGAFLQAHPDLVQKFVNADVKAVQYWNSHPTELEAALSTAYSVQPFVLARLVAPQTVGLNIPANERFIVNMPLSDIKSMANLLYRLGYLKQNVTASVSSHINYSFLMNATGSSESSLGA